MPSSAASEAVSIVALAGGMFFPLSSAAALLKIYKNKSGSDISYAWYVNHPDACKGRALDFEANDGAN